MSEQGKPEVPFIQEEFAEHLAKYRVKAEMVTVIAENIGEVGGPIVFENPELLNEKLTSWSQYIGATLRKQVLDHWFAKKGIPVSEEVAKQFALSSTQLKKEDKSREKKEKLIEGAVWTVDVDDSGMPRIRMIKDETEPGVTLAQAKAAAKEIGKEGEEPIAVYNEELGRHMPNFKSPFVKQNPAAAWATARTMDRAMVEGETVDPMDTWIEQQAKIAQLKEVLGAGVETRERGTVSEVVSAMKELQEMGGKANEGLRAELAELRQSVLDLKEERHRDEIASLQIQIRAQDERMADIRDKMEELKRPVTGRTEIDIIHEVASEAVSLAKAELPSLRRDIREAVIGDRLPAPKSPEQRDERKVRYKKAIETDRRIEQLGRKIFFGETPEPEVPPPQPPQEKATPIIRQSPSVVSYE